MIWYKHYNKILDISLQYSMIQYIEMLYAMESNAIEIQHYKV